MSRPGAWVREDPRTKHSRKKRWQVVYTDPVTNRRRTRGGFATKRQANDSARSFCTMPTRAPGRPDKGRHPVLDLAYEWLATLPTGKARTRAGYRTIIELERVQPSTTCRCPMYPTSALPPGLQA